MTILVEDGLGTVGPLLEDDTLDDDVVRIALGEPEHQFDDQQGVDHAIADACRVGREPAYTQDRRQGQHRVIHVPGHTAERLDCASRSTPVLLRLFVSAGRQVGLNFTGVKKEWIDPIGDAR